MEDTRNEFDCKVPNTPPITYSLMNKKYNIAKYLTREKNYPQMKVTLL